MLYGRELVQSNANSKGPKFFRRLEILPKTSIPYEYVTPYFL